MKIGKRILTAGVAMATTVALSGVVLAVEAAPGGGTPPDKPGGSSFNSAPSYKGATTISSNKDASGAKYSSSVGGQNALLVSGGTVSLKDPIITKSGDSSSEDSDFYGDNAAVLAYNDATLNITGGDISTSGAHANAVFAYSKGVINLSRTKIATTGNNSGGVMVTGGGKLTAAELKVKTAGNSSAAIRSDRGGGTMKISGGSYKTTGKGSPAIYSTADVTVKKSKLTATVSEGVVIEGSNSVTLEKVRLKDTNNTLNGNSETYKNIFIYQSMSGDANEGTGKFTAKKSKITTNQGDHFYVTNTTALITLSDNQFKMKDKTGVFLRAEAGKWGSSGKNGGIVSMNVSKQTMRGDFVVDKVSKLSLKMADSSYLKGAINAQKTAKSAELELSQDSVVVLTSDSYLTSLENADSENNNIYSNGHTLYVAGKAVEVNNATPPTGKKRQKTKTTQETQKPENSSLITWLSIGAGVVLVLIIITLVVMARQNRRK